MVTAEVWSAAGMPAPTIKEFNASGGDFLCANRNHMARAKP